MASTDATEPVQTENEPELYKQTVGLPDRVERVKNKPRSVPLSLSLERDRKIGAKTQEENLQDSFIDNRGRFLVARL